MIQSQPNKMQESYYDGSSKTILIYSVVGKNLSAILNADYPYPRTLKKIITQNDLRREYYYDLVENMDRIIGIEKNRGRWECLMSMDKNLFLFKQRLIDDKFSGNYKVIFIKDGLSVVCYYSRRRM